MKSCVTISLVEEARGGPFVFWHDLPAACRAAKELGFHAIELFAPSASAVNTNELRKLLGDCGLQLAAVGTGAGWVKQRLHVALPKADQRLAARDFIRSIIDLGGTFGAPAIIGSMQGRGGDGVTKEAALGWLREALDELGAYALQYNTCLLYEPLNRYETDQINRVNEGVSLVSGLACRNVRLLCDLFHMNIEEVDIAAAIRAAGPHLGHVHFVDSNRRPVGCGHLDVRPIMAALREIGYQGYLSAEALPYPNSRAAAEQTMRAFRYFTQSEI